ncbi:SRPBCC domain-containing protein [Mucilaginibacter terrigena]|uniref:SRPBCC domain-containing protein n=1 Tax=Mucilaginibacter terrigena TaxID=2492395 RepID=A0A4Q5LPG4_9SPHI|nr:SRPBCC domain-containing protein [Mucilaginibacter terrigena]RYU91296.1 SRPBCC domain-containing protein [Mucilaginibacter terrigena]
MINHEAVFTKDIANKKLNVVRSFNAGLTQVWQAWTNAEILDQWWAPRPYKAITKSMDFTVGGQWLYSMKGPEGDEHFCRVDYKSIDPQKSISAASMFCDENGNVNPNFPVMCWKQDFSEANGVATVNVEITFDKIEDMETIIKMGFEGGFNMGLNNLDEYLAGK